MTKDYDEILLLSDSKFIKQKEYWAGKLAGDFDNTLFLAHPGGPQPQTETAAAAIPFPGELCAPLMKLSKGSDLSLYMILLTALKWLIRQYTGSPEVVVISPVYIQNISEDTINDLLFVRDAVHGGKPFVQLLLDIRRSVLEAYENQDYPSDELINYLFHDLQERSGSNISISNVVCLLKNIHDDRAVEKELQDKLVFSFEREEDRITGTIFYNPHVYETVYLENVSGQFIHLLTNAVPDVRQEISDIDFLTGEERKQLLFEFNGSAAPYGKDETIHALFEQQAEKTPDHIALVREEEGSPWLMSVSYRELNNRANRLARVLREKGVLPDTVVPIMAEDADLMVIGMMAILKAGGAYLPLNPDYPGERKKMMLLDSAAPILVMQSTLDGGFAGDHAAAIHLDDESIYTGGVSNPAPVNTPRDLMYVMYTSGTTGKPKGVGLSHRNACNVLTWFGKRYNLRPHTHVLQLTDYFFDPSVEDIFGTLIHGGTLYTGPRDLVADRELFSQFVRRNRVYLVNYVPTMLKELLSGGPPLESLQVVIAGGERLEDGVKDQLSSKGYNLYNNYGPTEITVDALSLKCDEKKVTLGRPAANTRCY
ncbi:MAG: AMP-binding protein, partial [bacterium]|nr:AMP-binding protein [bacterium]